MDKESITASIIVILTAVKQDIEAIKAFHDAPEQIDSILDDLADTEVMVRTVESSLETNSNQVQVPQKQLEHIWKELAESKEDLLELEVLIRIQIKERRSIGILDHAAWLVVKDKAANAKKKLNTVCEKLLGALGQMKTSCIELELQNVSVEEQTEILPRGRGNETMEDQQQELKTMSEGQNEIIETACTARSTTVKILEKFECIEKVFYTEQMPPKRYNLRLETVEGILDDVTSRSEKGLENTEVKRTKTITTRYRRVAVRARHREHFQCANDCLCNCHAKSGMYSPDGLRHLLGQLFVGYNGPSGVKNACSYARCARKEAPTSSITYFFPHWWVSQRMSSLVIQMMALAGPEAILKVPRIVSPTARIFRHCYLAEVDSLRALFTTGLGSPADTDSKTGATPLRYAYTSGNEELIKYLLYKGADRNAKNFAGLSPTEEAWTRLLTNSVIPSHRKVFESLCDKETLEEFDFTDLHRSVVRIKSSSVEEELKALTGSSATIDDTDAAGRTALSWSSQLGDAETMQILLECGADPNKATPNSKHPLHYTTGTTTSAKCTKKLLDFGADVHARDNVGLTPLIWACINVSDDDYSNLEALLDCSDIELTDQNGRTALFHAVSANITPTNMLLSRGCNVNHTDDEGFSALHLAILYNRGEVIQTLVKNGIDYHCRLFASNRGILHHAACYARVESMEVLLASQLVDLDINAKDNEGYTALDLLETRVPEPSAKVIELFHRLVGQIEARTALPNAKADVISKSDDIVGYESGSKALFGGEDQG